MAVLGLLSVVVSALTACASSPIRDPNDLRVLEDEGRRILIDNQDVYGDFCVVSGFESRARRALAAGDHALRKERIRFLIMDASCDVKSGLHRRTLLQDDVRLSARELSMLFDALSLETKGDCKHVGDIEVGLCFSRHWPTNISRNDDVYVVSYQVRDGPVSTYDVILPTICFVRHRDGFVLGNCKDWPWEMDRTP